MGTKKQFPCRFSADQVMGYESKMLMMKHYIENIRDRLRLYMYFAKAANPGNKVIS
jgi:hypothetical protein